MLGRTPERQLSASICTVHIAQGTIRIDQVYACVDGCVHVHVHVHVCGIYMYREISFFYMYNVMNHTCTCTCMWCLHV